MKKDNKKIKRVTISMDEDLWERVKITAIQERKKFSEFMIESVREYIQNNKNKNK